MLYVEYLKHRHPCPFCHPGQRVVKRAQTAYMTYALAPYAPYHLLIVPKRHVELVAKLTAREFKDIISLMRVAMRIYKKQRIADYSFLLRNGANSGRSVKHVHMNIVPHHRLGDLDENSAKRLVLADVQVAKLLSRLRKLSS